MVLASTPSPDVVSLWDTTRLKRVPLSTQIKPTGGGTTVVQLTPTGLLRGVLLRITVVETGTPDAANALGICSAIRQVRLRTNGATDIYQGSGAGYVYGVNEIINTGKQVGMTTTQNQGASAVAAGTFELDMYLPVAMNWRDPIGIFLLQNREINVNLEIEWEADTVVTGGATATYTGTCTPIMEYYTVPDDPKLYQPYLAVVHQFTEESQVISGAGDFTYNPVTGQIYLNVLYGAYWAQSAADSFSRIQEIVGASDRWEDLPSALVANAFHSLEWGRLRRAGSIFRSFMATAGLGNLSETDRDMFDTLGITNFQHVLTMTGAGTVRIVKEQLVRVGSN